jgi:hypothetical protein
MVGDRVMQVTGKVLTLPHPDAVEEAAARTRPVAERGAEKRHRQQQREAADELIEASPANGREPEAREENGRPDHELAA